ncbi:MAG: YbaY family lipoprotein [Planctomycetota bacterium]|nr:YbaY family lipoprotein [Planctomycetota bacterium]
MTSRHYRLGLHLLSCCCLWIAIGPIGQAQSWLGFNAAVPKVAPGYGSGVTVNAPGVAPSIPSTPTAYPAGLSPAAPTLVPTTKLWKLGVVVRNTDVGAIVQTVEPNSAAQTAGILPGDSIIAVSGTRIGEFDGRVVEIGEEIKRYVDSLGRVPLLIQDSRTRALRSSVVTLTSAATALSGSVSLADRGSLPIGSVLTIQLQNLTRPFYEVAGGKTVLKAEGPGPFRFDLFIDPRYLTPTDQYQLTAFVSSNNQVVYNLRQPVLVPVQGLNQLYNLALERPYTPAPTTIATNPINTTTFNSGVVTASLPAAPSLPGQVSTDALNQIFVSLLGRQPSSRELIAWQDYMQQGHTLNEVAAKIMASPQFRERYATDQAYVQQVIQTLTGKLATSNDVNYWVGRMTTLGSPEKMIAELMAQKK